jgi:hypothetical protein
MPGNPGMPGIDAGEVAPGVPDWPEGGAPLRPEDGAPEPEGAGLPGWPCG